MSAKRERVAAREGREAGFTLVEALVAMVILIFGLMAVTNLLLVAASSNSVANQGTAATTSASDALERLKQTSFLNVAPGGNLDADTTAPPPACAVAVPADYNCVEVVPGVGSVVTRWQVNPVGGTGRLYYIQVRSEGTGVLAGRRSRAEFTTFRSCTAAPPDGACPPAP